MSGLLIGIGYVFGFTVWQIVFRFVIAGASDPKRDETRILRRFALTACSWILLLSVASCAAYSTHREGALVVAGIAGAPVFSIAGLVDWLLRRKRTVPR